MTAETRTFTGVGSYTLTYGSYNLAGELTSMTNQTAGATVGYTYDNVGRPTGVTGSGYGGVSNYASAIGYRAFGAMKQMNYGNGKSLSLQFDNRMRVTNWSVPNVLGWQYFYSDVGENTGRVMFARNTASSTVGGGGRDDKLDRSFDYDHVGRLIVSHTGYEARLHMNRQQAGDSTNYGPYSQAYNYDLWGNMTTRVGWGGWNGAYVNWTPNYSNNRLTTNPATGATMTYDLSGNLKYDGYQTFTYDATGQQTTATGNGLSQSYDGDRLRVKKTENSTTTYYLRSSVLGGQVVAELNGSGAFARGYVYLGGQMVAIQKDNAVSWVHQDPVTKSQRVTNGSGTVVSTIDLDPWGGETATSSNQAFQPHRFTTYERDANGGDDAMMRRYAGSWMRFSQPDPYGGSYDMTDPQSFNRYSYVRNDPVNFVDPMGLDGELGNTIAGNLWYFTNPPTVTVTAPSPLLGSGPDIGFVPEAGTPDETESPGGGPQNPGGQFTANHQADVTALTSRVNQLLQNPNCANILGGTRNAQALLNRAQVRSANTINPNYRGTGGRFPGVARRANSLALNPNSNNAAFSEVGQRGLRATNIYLNNRFFANSGPSQQETIFIHELNRNKGYRGTDKADYANITKACGTADPYGPKK